MKRIAYGKIGRVIELDEQKWGESGGDNEAPVLLLELADRNPDVEWVVVGKNSGWEPPRKNIVNPWQEWKDTLRMKSNAHAFDRIRRFDEITLPTFADLDGIVMWVGQHGSSNFPIPKIDDRSVLTSPQTSFIAYSSFILRGINYWRREDPLNREEVWLLADVRNYIKGRDLKWPRRHPILAQYDFSRTEKMERYGDLRTPEECGFEAEAQDGIWTATDNYIASGLELVGVPAPRPLSDLPSWDERDKFGIIINETRGYGMRPELTRLDAVQRYVKPLEPSWIHGTWTPASLEKLGTDVQPIEYNKVFGKMASVKATFTTPSSGSGWATVKPWESFGMGTICFFHPGYDTQGHIIPTLAQAEGKDDEASTLAKWLRVTSPDELKSRVESIESSRETYEWLAAAQYRHLEKAIADKRCVTLIEKRLGL